MDSVSQFLHMGGYAVFVWPAFGIAAVVLTALLWWSLRDLRKERQLLDSVPRRGADAEREKAENDS